MIEDEVIQPSHEPSTHSIYEVYMYVDLYLESEPPALITSAAEINRQRCSLPCVVFTVTIVLKKIRTRGKLKIAGSRVN